jgi:hypothetical protein
VFVTPAERKAELEKAKLNEWRSDAKCLKSVFSILPQELEERAERQRGYKMMAFRRSKRFSHDVRDKEQVPLIDPDPSRVHFGKCEKPVLEQKSTEIRGRVPAPKDGSLVGSATKQAKSLRMKAAGSANRQGAGGPLTLPKETCKSLLFLRQLQKDGTQVVQYD